MNNQEFESNLIKYIKKIYSEFNEYQSIAKSILDEFCRICDKHGIHYQLAYGSLLGAIRDNGQIPWDYDIDVFVPYNEKEKVICALKKSLSNKYYAKSPEFDKNSRYNMLRIAPKEWNSAFLHVDVFYLIGTPNEYKKRKRFCKKIKRICQIKKLKLTDINEATLGSKFVKLKKIYFMIFKILYIFISVKYLDMRYNKLCSRYPIKDSKILSTGDIFATWYEFPNEMLNIKQIEIDGKLYNIPKNYDEILKIMYGNYMNHPQIEKCFSEFNYRYQRLSKYGKLKK